jgi:BMFP domain-containing protein YqiC
MDEIKEMLRAVINGQHALRTEFNAGFAESDKKIETLRKELQKEMREGFDAVNERLDKQGKQLAYLEDDAPTREEFDDLKKRVEKLEVN